MYLRATVSRAAGAGRAFAHQRVDLLEKDRVLEDEQVRGEDEGGRVVEGLLDLGLQALQLRLGHLEGLLEAFGGHPVEIGRGQAAQAAVAVVDGGGPRRAPLGSGLAAHGLAARRRRGGRRPARRPRPGREPAAGRSR